MKTILLTGTLLLIFLGGALRLPAAELIANGSFEAAAASGPVPAGWTLQSGATAFPTVQRSSAQVKAGAWALRVDARADKTDGVRQNIMASLTAAPNTNGSRYAFRGWIRLDDFASVRVFLRAVDTAGALPDLLLAERTVLTPTQWVKVEGSATIAWTGALQSATIIVQVIQLAKPKGVQPARLLPGFYLDDLTMDVDADGDGLLDREEPTLGLSAAKADTDGDGLPDWWEVDNKFSGSNDAAGDADGDGFSNREEYLAATDPRSAASYPGKPANPNASVTTRAVLRWLALLPAQAPGRHLASGQHVSDLSSDLTEYPRMIDALAGATGKYPAIISLAIEPPYDRFGKALQIAEAESRALAYASAGGLVMMKWAIYNPWSGNNAVDPAGVDMAGLLNPAGSAPGAQTANQAARTTLLGWMATVADTFDRLQAQGVVVLFRPISEMNGTWFWWGHQERADYVALWEFLYDYFTITRGLNNLIWVMETDSGTHALNSTNSTGNPSDYYYPGDSLVDVFCHNLYDADWVLPFDSHRLYSRFPKIFGVPQAGPDHANRDGTFNNLVYLQQSEAAMPRSSFFVVWNSFTGADLTTGLNSVQKIGLVDNVNAIALMNSASIVTRDTVSFSAPVVPVTPVTPAPATPAPATPATPASPAAGGGGGGGAPSPWFLAALSLAALARLRSRRHGKSGI